MLVQEKQAGNPNHYLEFIPVTRRGKSPGGTLSVVILISSFWAFSFFQLQSEIMPLLNSDCSSKTNY